MPTGKWMRHSSASFAICSRPTRRWCASREIGSSTLPSSLRMPRRRLFGNAVLSILAKFASGYWNVIDPTNGYIAFNAALLALLPWQSFADSYFFEISVLCELGLKRLPILELEMPTIYTGARSSLSIPAVLGEFPPKLFRLMLRRIMLQYFIFDVNLGSIYSSVRHLAVAGRRRMGNVSVDRELDHARIAHDRNGHARRPALPDGIPVDPQRLDVRRPVRAEDEPRTARQPLPAFSSYDEGFTRPRLGSAART